MPRARWNASAARATRRHCGQQDLSRLGLRPRDNEQAAELEAAQVGMRLHCCTQCVDLGLTGVRMPAMREAELHIARGRLTLEERHVNTHHGALAQEAWGGPEEVEVALHALLVSINDDEVEGLESAAVRLGGETLEYRHRRPDSGRNLLAGEALELEAPTEFHHEGVELEGADLAIRRHGLGERQGARAAEGADFEHAARGIGEGEPAEGRHTLLARGPLGPHVHLRESLLVVALPVLLLNGFAKFCEGRARLRRRPSLLGGHGLQEVAVREGGSRSGTA
mmetsp:Transcript_32182/g.102100  ORF Transcript_32182/g.102100 Transcript_32182/m.102100 type:complete len:281 (+) Transcript_32182:268-1110(+)